MDWSLLPEGDVSKSWCSWVGGVSQNLTRLPSGPGEVQVLEGWQIAADPLSLAVAAVCQMVVEEVRLD